MSKELNDIGLFTFACHIKREKDRVTIQKTSYEILTIKLKKIFSQTYFSHLIKVKLKLKLA